MADGLNKVMVMGNLGQDPELRVTQGGQAVLEMGIAVNQSYLDKNRVRQETVEWVRCVVWGRRAEALAKFLRKGASVFVEGSLKTNSWEDRETGVKRYKTVVVARNVILGGSNKPRNQPNDPERRANRREHYDDDAPSGGGGRGGGGYDDQDYGSSGYDDDIPF